MSISSRIMVDGAIGLSTRKLTNAHGNYAVLAAASLGGSLVFVSSSVVTVALASIGRDLGLSPLQLQWTVNAELLPVAALSLLAGALGDRLGHKRVFLAGIALFGIGVMAAAAAGGFPILVSGRFLQGAGEAFILPNSLSVLGQAFSAQSKARAVGVWSAVAAIASAVAPATAGLILDHNSWRVTFLVLVPLIVTAFALVAISIPPDLLQMKKRIDVGGAVLSIIGLGALGAGLTSLSSGTRFGGEAASTLGLGLCALVALVILERRRGNDAMLPLKLFASRSVVGANIFTVLLYGPFTVALTLLPFVMIRGAHLSTAIAGAAFIPLQLFITIVSPFAGLLCRRFGRRLPLIAGGLVVAAGCAMALRIGPSALYWRNIFPSVVLLALGMSLVVAPLTTLVLTTVEPSRAGTASGINGALSRAGSLFAVALLGGVLQKNDSMLFGAFHTVMLSSALICVVAVCSVFIVKPGPHVDYVPVD